MHQSLRFIARRKDQQSTTAYQTTMLSLHGSREASIMKWFKF